MIKIANLEFDEHNLVDVIIKAASVAPTHGVPRDDTRPEAEETDKKELNRATKGKKKDAPLKEGKQGATELVDPDQNIAFVSKVVGKIEGMKERKRREDREHVRDWLRKRLKGDEVTEQNVDSTNQEEKASQQGT